MNLVSGSNFFELPALKSAAAMTSLSNDDEQEHAPPDPIQRQTTARQLKLKICSTNEQKREEGEEVKVVKLRLIKELT